MKASSETQEQWQRFYDEATKQSGDRDMVGAMLQKADARRIWQTVFMIGSTAFMIGLTTFFYDVLTR